MNEKRLRTVHEFWELPEPPDTRHELVRGEVVNMGFQWPLRNLIVGNVLMALFAYSDKRRRGYPYTSGLGYVLREDPATVRRPDVSFVRRESIPANLDRNWFWPCAPDLVVEVVLPEARAPKAHDRVRDCFAAGTRMAWVLWPEQEMAVIHTQSGTRTLAATDTLDGGDLLPGFAVSVVELFAVDP